MFLQTLPFLLLHALVGLLTLTNIQGVPKASTVAIGPPLAYIAFAGLTALLIGLCRERALRRVSWIAYATILAYITVPFAAYAASKGLLSRNIGDWAREQPPPSAT